MGPAHVHLVSAPSSCGKSHFIARARAQFDEIVFPTDLERTALQPMRRYALHYNLLRPFERAHELLGARGLERRARGAALAMRLKVKNPFDADPPLADLLARGAELSATVLVVSRATLERRMRARTVREGLVDDGRGYSPEKWLAILRSVDLARVYRSWTEFLRRERVPYDLISAETEDYPPVGPDALGALLEARA